MINLVGNKDCDTAILRRLTTGPCDRRRFSGRACSVGVGTRTEYELTPWARRFLEAEGRDK